MTHDKDRADAKKLIDENLRRVYRDDTPDEVPDRFRSLLEKLKTKETPPETRTDGD